MPVNAPCLNRRALEMGIKAYLSFGGGGSGRDVLPLHTHRPRLVG